MSRRKFLRAAASVGAGFSALLALPGCDLGLQPYAGKAPEEALESLQDLRAATRGNYHILVGDGYYTYNRHLFYMGEFPSDNVSLSGTTTDPLFYAYTYNHVKGMANAENIWRWGYRIVHGANQVLEAAKEGTSPEMDQTMGENHFLRAMVHFQLVNLFGRPYPQGRDNLGVPIVDRADMVDARPPRNTVGEVYDFVVKDLQQAATLMTLPESSSFASREVAYALLSRVHLYMEENEKAVEYANRVLDSGRYHLVDTGTYKSYFTTAPENNPETIFAIKHTKADNHGYGAIGSMYLTSDEGVGWGEMYASKDFRQLLDRYPEDARHAFIVPQYKRNESGEVIHDANGDPVLQKRNGYPKYFVNKFSYQQGIPMLSSPVITRLAEMYLNRAEAAAKMGNSQQAVEDVNRIRRRAGLSGEALYSVGDLKGHDSVLDVVLEERRLELAFEAHRRSDLFRNGRALKRDYPGTHLNPSHPGVNMAAGTQIIPSDHPRVIYYIPQDAIELNPNLTQNP